MSEAAGEQRLLVRFTRASRSQERQAQIYLWSPSTAFEDIGLTKFNT